MIKFEIIFILLLLCFNMKRFFKCEYQTLYFVHFNLNVNITIIPFNISISTTYYSPAVTQVWLVHSLFPKPLFLSFFCTLFIPCPLPRDWNTCWNPFTFHVHSSLTFWSLFTVSINPFVLETCVLLILKLFRQHCNFL